MNFFNDVDTTAGGEFSSGGGELLPIPKDTNVLAVCEEAKNSSYEGISYINLKWRVHQPAEYANRVLFQKVKVYDYNPDVSRKAKQMLFAIATNAGGKLFEVMKQNSEQEPSDASLTRITNVPMVLKLGVWDMNGKTGNWVQAVSPRKASQPAPQPEVDDIPGW